MNKIAPVALVVLALLAAPASFAAVVVDDFVPILSDPQTTQEGTVWSVQFEVTLTSDDPCGPYYYATEVDGDTVTLLGGDTVILCAPAGPEYVWETEAIQLAEGSYTAVIDAFGEEVATFPFTVGQEGSFEVDTDPSPPVEGEPFSLVVSGVWPDGCVPTAGDVAVEGDTILVRGLGPACGAVCTLAAEAYSFETDPVGPLDDGVWKVEYRVTSCLGETDLGTRQIQVVPRLGLPGCEPAPDVLCLDGETPGDRRFTVDADWFTGRDGGGAGPGRPVQGLPPNALAGGLIWFFDSRNPEMLVKILDGCGINGHFWVFLAATTDVGYELEITDEVSGLSWTTENADGTLAEPVADVEAFPCT